LQHILELSHKIKEALLLSAEAVLLHAEAALLALKALLLYIQTGNAMF